MAIVFNNSARANTAPDMTPMLHMTSLRIVKRFEEYQHKTRGPNSMVNIQETGQHIFAPKEKHKECLSQFPFLLGTAPSYFTPA